MVGLSVVLESHHHHHRNGHTSSKTNSSSTPPQVISKTSMSVVMAFPYSARLSSPRSSSSSSSSSSSPSLLPSFPAPAFLEKCFLCRAKLLPGKDIYMYKGDRAFCSEECRCRQIFMDDQEETQRKQNCSMAAIKPSATAASPNSSSPSSPSSSASSRHRRASRNHHRAGGFAY